MSLTATSAIDKKTLDDTRNQTFTVLPDSDTNPEGFVVITPAPLAEDYNHCFRSEFDAWGWLVQARIDHVNGMHWDIKPEDKPKGAQVICKAFASIPVSKENTTTAKFLHFPANTPTQTVWCWIESYFDVSIGADYSAN